MDEPDGDSVKVKRRRWRKSKDEREVEKVQDESQLEVRWNLSDILCIVTCILYSLHTCIPY